MKKVSLVALLLATSTAVVPAASAVAETLVPGCPKSFEGFGLKGNLGYQVGFATAKSNFSTPDFVGRNNAKLGFNGVDGGIGVDYNRRMCNWLIGLGFDASWTNARTRHSFRLADTVTGTVIGRTNHRFQLRNTLQLFARLGYVIGGQVNPFVGLGWSNAQWKQGHRHNGTIFESNNHHHNSKRVNSFLWKFGVDFLLTKHLIGGFEYTGTGGGRQKLHRNRTAVDGFALRSSFKAQTNKIAATLKIIY